MGTINFLITSILQDILFSVGRSVGRSVCLSLIYKYIHGGKYLIIKGNLGPIWHANNKYSPAKYLKHIIDFFFDSLKAFSFE